MGFLGRVSKEGGDQPGTTVVAGGTKIVGDLQLSDDFHLDGCMEGRLRSSLNVSVGVNGQFDGEIEAKKVMISGRVDGTIDAERLEIVSTGRVTGEIKVTELVIEPGGQFSGTSQIKEAGESAPRQLTYTSSAQQPTEVNDTDNGSDSDKDASLRVDPSIAV